MNAEAFDRAMSLRDEVRQRELAVYDGLMRGYQDVLDGKTIPAADAISRIRAERGWK